MAINSFEVGAIFTIKDQSTAVLREMAAQMERIEGLTKSATAALSEFGKGIRISGLVTRMNELGESMKIVAASSAELKTSFISDFETINAGLFSTVQMARELAIAMADIGVAGVAMSRGVAIGGSAGGGHGKGGGGFLSGMAKGAGAGTVLSHPATFVAGYAAFESMKISAQLQDAVGRSMIAMGIPVTPDYMETRIAQKLQGQIREVSHNWGMPLPQAEESALQAIRGLAPLSSEDRMRLLPSVLNFAGAEVSNKHGTTPEEATEAGIGLAHQLRLYTPEKIEPIFGALTRLSMASPQSLSQIARMSSYYLPLLTAGLDMDPTKLMAMGAVGGQMNLNTKSGTWLARMFEAPFTHDLTESRQKDRRNALEELGLVNVKRDMMGNVVGSDVVTKDPFEFVKILSEHLQSLPDKRRLSDLNAAFGEQGSKGATIWTDPAVLKNLQALFESLKNAPSVEDLRRQSMNLPGKKIEVEMADFNLELGKLGNSLLPIAITAMKGLNVLIENIESGGFWHELEYWATGQYMGDIAKNIKDISKNPDNHPNSLPSVIKRMGNDLTSGPKPGSVMDNLNKGKPGLGEHSSNITINGPIHVAANNMDEFATSIQNALARSGVGNIGQGVRQSNYLANVG